MSSFVFYRLVAALTGGMMMPQPVIRGRSISYLMMRMQTARAARDGRCAHHRAGLRAQMVSLSTRYRGKR